MTKVSYEDRIEFWKFQHASITFSEVTQLCDFLLKQKIDSRHPLHAPLMTALHTLYGRPFRQRKETRITEDIVPQAAKDTHDVLMNMRDKIHAHIDTDGPSTTEDDCLNKVVVSVRAGEARFALMMVSPRDIQIEKIRELADALTQKTWYHAEKTWKRYFKTNPPKDGDYEVNISRSQDAFLKANSW